MNTEQLLKEVTFKAVRSSGPGGQHVNKTSSKVEVSLNISVSKAFSETEINRLEVKLANRISQEGILTLSCSESRSQHRNKALVVQRLIVLLEKNIKIPKRRKKTKPSKGAIEKRIKAKKNNALKKVNRKPPRID
ncbi:aminoacyl-tRNA hydrolase [Patiriisocius marinistellae]|uniref:Aminoacyl-tRNA hydrolase n=1 Tax=Patiriisocius marinistellae TaxID=2494560 RepID=A0A5J4FX44_9FLAO|nr:alternative ribosome rescue aminoacyl-tRNA hydrolase ArfB [Patiriisocius marinistellae]GEQ84605.1 aminoacyl-tRNA hydrolase [Patiriisocius marinistellae]